MPYIPYIPQRYMAVSADSIYISVIIIVTYKRNQVRQVSVSFVSNLLTTKVTIHHDSDYKVMWLDIHNL